MHVIQLSSHYNHHVHPRAWTPSTSSRPLRRMSTVSLPTLTGAGRTNQPIYTLSTVRGAVLYGSRSVQRAVLNQTCVGIDDRLASKLTASLPPDVLRAFVELYCDVLREWSSPRGNFNLADGKLTLRATAVEERIFSIDQPQAFFTMFGNSGGAASADLAIEAFEDDLKLTGRAVRLSSHPCPVLTLSLTTLLQILNVLATVNENPYIRYYQPAHHNPLGPLANDASSSSTLAPPSATLQQSQQASQSLRWRSAMGGATKVAEPVGDFLCKKIAVQVQNDLDEYMANNPEFPVCRITSSQLFWAPSLWDDRADQ